MGTVFITHGTAQPQDTDSFMDIDLIFYAETTFRRRFLIAAIVVAVYI